MQINNRPANVPKYDPWKYQRGSMIQTIDVLHGLAVPFLSYRVTLNARKTRDFIGDLFIWQSYKLGPLRQSSDSS